MIVHDKDPNRLLAAVCAVRIGSVRRALRSDRPEGLTPPEHRPEAVRHRSSP
ncbi:hypothetical protein BN2537_10617 [Streptomyces venezuelae]|nr:hypothetical protein BN2537_10617 [Streptomyces venezuelae]